MESLISYEKNPILFFAISLAFISPKSISRDLSAPNTNARKYMINTENSEEKISGKKFEIVLIAFNEFKKNKKIFMILKYISRTTAKILK